MNTLETIAAILAGIGIFLLYIWMLAGIGYIFIQELTRFGRSYLVLISTAALFFLLLSIPIIIISQATAQVRHYDPTMGDLHDPNDPTHWYPQACCSLNDCEPLDVDNFTETKDGYEINYYSERFNQRNKGFISHNDPKIQPSQDGGFHACWILSHPDRGEADGRFGGGGPSHVPFGNTPAMGYGPVSPIRCFFKPNNS